MISQQLLYSGSERDIAVAQVISSDYQLTKICTTMFLAPTSSTTASAILPPANDQTMQLGGPHWWIYNGDATHNLLIKDATGSTKRTLTPSQGCIVSLLSNTNAAGVWWFDVRSRLT